MSEDQLLALLAAGSRGVLATLKRSGRPQLSTVDYAYDPAARVIRLSTTADRAKVGNLRRDPRASFYVSGRDGAQFAVAEGTAELSAAAADPGDAAVEELIGLYRDVQGEHPDWADYRAAMVADRRLVVRVHVERAYGYLRE
jgi:PPOX class probable F420-dependent enzyme